MTGMRFKRGAGWIVRYIFLCSADCGRYGEVIFGVGDAFYWPLLMSRSSHCREVSIRVNQMYGTSAGTKNRGRCGEVTVVGRWPLVEVRLYIRCIRRKSNKSL